jgi:hypothetical protein
MIDARRLGVLHVDGNITLTATVDLAAGGGDVHPVGHVAVFELIDEFIHHRLDHSRGIGARNVTVQPTLGMGNHGYRILGAADHEARLFQRLDQRIDLGRIRHQVLDVAADGESNITIGVAITDVTQLAQGKDIENTLGTGPDRPDLLTTVCVVTKYARSWMVMPFPLAEVFRHHRVHVLKPVRAAGFDGFAHLYLSHYSLLVLSIAHASCQPAAASFSSALRSNHLTASSSQPSIRT